MHKKQGIGHSILMERKRENYGFDFYCLLFFILAFIGWVWEVVLHLITEHAFVNRGIYRGPYLPIYGAGGLIICLCFGRLKNHPFRVFAGSLMLCSVLEYLTGYLLERKWGIRWWDYSGHFLNVNGRICLLSAVGFGLSGILLVCVVYPFYKRVMTRIPRKIRIVLMILCVFVFVADAAKAAVYPNMGQGISYVE